MPSGPSIETYVERNHTARETALRRLNDAEAALGNENNKASKKRIEGKQESAQNSLWQLLEERGGGLNDIASVADQMESCGGSEKWNDQFTRLSDVESHPNTVLKGEALRSYIRSRVPDSRFKRFQELFSGPENFVVPKFVIDEEENVLFSLSKNDFNTISLAGCLVSADAVPDLLAEDLTLCTFEEGDRPLMRIEKKKAVIARLKKIYESLEPLVHGQQRLLVISESSREINERYPDVEGADPSTLGTMLYIRGNGQNGSALHHKKVAQHFPSSYGAARKTGHQDAIYKEEIKSLIGIKSNVSGMNRKLNDEWRTANEDERNILRESAKAVLAEAVEKLESCFNMYKVDAHGALAAAAELKDKNDRENITVAMTKMVRALNDVEKRFKEMRGKGGVNKEDEMSILATRELEEQRLEKFRSSVMTGLRVLDKNNLVLFNPDVTLTAPQKEANATGMLKKAQIDLSLLEEIELQPLRIYADALRTETGLLKQSLVDGNKNEAIGHAVTMHLIGKVQAMRTMIEGMKEKLVNPERVSISHIREFVALFRKFFDTEQIFPGFRVNETVTGMFEKLSKGLVSMEARLEFYETEDLTTEERVKLYMRIKKYLNTYELEEMVRQLVTVAV